MLDTCLPAGRFLVDPEGPDSYRDEPPAGPSPTPSRWGRGFESLQYKKADFHLPFTSSLEIPCSSALKFCKYKKADLHLPFLLNWKFLVHLLEIPVDPEGPDSYRDEPPAGPSPTPFPGGKGL
jgi:hypothetical protein